MRIYSLNRLENIRDNTEIIMQRLREIKPKKKHMKKSSLTKKKTHPESKINEQDENNGPPGTTVAASADADKDYEDDFHPSSKTDENEIPEEIIDDEIADETLTPQEKEAEKL